MSFDICVFWDSIVWGAWDDVVGGWVSRVSEYVKAKNDNIFVYNCGVSGDNTDGLIKRFQAEAFGREADVILFAIGINDAQYIHTKENSRVPLERFEQNIQWLIDQAAAITDKVCFLWLTNIDQSKTMPIPWSPTKFYDKENVWLYNKKLQEVCEKNQILFVDMLPVLNADDLIDGLHPNPLGYQKIYLHVKGFLEEQQWI
jgi:lysophospholipase L1-like esterase